MARIRLASKLFSVKTMSATALVIAIFFTVAIQLKDSNLKAVQKESLLPETCLRISNKIADFSNPLPDGFKWHSAFSVFNSENATLQHFNPYMFVEVSRETPLATGVAFIDSSLAQGAKLGRGTTSPNWDKTSEGKLTVAGQTLNYELGSVDFKNHHVDQLRGESVDQKNVRFSVEAYGEWDKPFNLELFKKFLSGIKSLK